MTSLHQERAQVRIQDEPLAEEQLSIRAILDEGLFVVNQKTSPAESAESVLYGIESLRDFNYQGPQGISARYFTEEGVGELHEVFDMLEAYLEDLSEQTDPEVALKAACAFTNSVSGSGLEDRGVSQIADDIRERFYEEMMSFQFLLSNGKEPFESFLSDRLSNDLYENLKEQLLHIQFDVNWMVQSSLSIDLHPESGSLLTRQEQEQLYPAGIASMEQALPLVAELHYLATSRGIELERKENESYEERVSRIEDAGVVGKLSKNLTSLLGMLTSGGNIRVQEGAISIDDDGKIFIHPIVFEGSQKSYAFGNSPDSII